MKMLRQRLHCMKKKKKVLLNQKPSYFEKRLVWPHVNSCLCSVSALQCLAAWESLIPLLQDKQEAKAETNWAWVCFTCPHGRDLLRSVWGHGAVSSYVLAIGDPTVLGGKRMGYTKTMIFCCVLICKVCFFLILFMRSHPSPSPSLWPGRTCHFVSHWSTARQTTEWPRIICWIIVDNKREVQRATLAIRQLLPLFFFINLICPRHGSLFFLLPHCCRRRPEHCDRKETSQGSSAFLSPKFDVCLFASLCCFRNTTDLML